MADELMIQAEGLKKRYGETQALDGVGMPGADALDQQQLFLEGQFGCEVFCLLAHEFLLLVIFHVQ